MDREVWQTSVHGVTKSQTQVSDSAHTHVTEKRERSGELRAIGAGGRMETGGRGEGEEEGAGGSETFL